MNSLSTKEILEKVSASGDFKAAAPVWKLLVLAVLAGAYIAFGAYGSTVASCNLACSPDTFGLSKLVSAAVFPVGLMMVVLCGAELFTGNCLMFTGLLDRRFKVSGMLRNWIIVYIGNLLGALLVAALINYSGLLGSADGVLGMVTIKTALGKCGIGFGQAFVRGIFCNWLVCLAIWMATGAQNSIGKIFSIWFCIGLFIVGGFEHSVANMYFIPAGLIAAGNESFVQLLGADISGLTVSAFFLKNLLPVTLGNIAGGGLFVGCVYWLTNRK